MPARPTPPRTVGNAGDREHVRAGVERETGLDSSERDRAFRDYILPELDVLLRVARRLTRRQADAEDLVQDTVLRAYRALHRFDGRYPRAWLLTIMRNTNINRIRKRQPVLLDDQDETFRQLSGDGADGRGGAQDLAVEAIPDRRLLEALADLSDAHRQVVALVDIEGLSYRETAETLGIPIGTVMSRLHRARKRVRTALEDQGYDPEVER